jgi:hypothetical protein
MIIQGSKSALQGYDGKYRQRTERLVEFTRDACKLYKELLNFPEDITITIKPMKKFAGLYYEDKKKVDLSFKSNPSIPFLEILAHELVHAEQHYTSKIHPVWLEKKRTWAYRWDGKLWDNDITDYQRYINQPWEIEAFARQSELALTVWEVLETKYS